MDPALWIAFVSTVIVMQMPPGPDSMLVVARRGVWLRSSPCWG
jgi:threonine/homoserine/homoserine lactone efflux protein